MVLACLCLAAFAPDAISVSPKGSDQGDGSLARPLRTIAAAVELSRKTGARLIALAPGTHAAAQTIVLEPKDKGLEIRGAGAARTLVSGGKRLDGWTKLADGLWQARLQSASPVMMLSINSRPRPKSRLPETGFYEHQSVFDVRWMSTTGGGWQRKPTPEELTTMSVKPADLPKGFSVKNAEVTVMHMWDESLAGVKAYDSAGGRLTFDQELGHPPGAFDVKKYAVWNLREGLTRPGQWMHDREAGRIIYWPQPGEDMARLDVWAAGIDKVFEIRPGTGDVSLSGFTLSHANTPLRRGGFGAGDAAGAIEASQAPGLSLKDLVISACAGQGVKLWECEGLKVLNCVSQDAGACGLRVDGKGMVVEDCLVERPGQVYPSAIGIHSSGVGHSVRHCTIRDTPYTAMLPGSDDCVAEYNLIEGAMKVLHDGAGIYTGFNKGAVIRRNIVRGIQNTGGYGACAYYVDEQGTGARVEENLSDGVEEPLRLHMAKDGLIRGNVFVSPGGLKVSMARSSGFRFERNVLSAQGEIVFSGKREALALLVENILFSASGKVVRELLDDYATVGREPVGEGDANVFTEPGFASPGRGFAKGSPALATGIVSEPWKGAGRRTKQPAKSG